MAIIQIKRLINADGPLYTEVLSGQMFGGEENAHQFIISAKRDGEIIPLSGAVTGSFINPDGDKVVLSGTINSDGAAVVTLDPDCYAVTGRFELTIFVTGDDDVTAVYSCRGTVRKTDSDTIIDPTHIVPSVKQIVAKQEELAQDVADASSAIASAQNAVSYLAPVFSTSRTYAVGEYVTKDGALYICTTAVETAGAWDASKWQAVTFGEELADVKSAVDVVSDQMSITQITSINAIPNASTMKLEGTSYGRSVYADIGDAKIVTVSKTPGRAFAVVFSAVTPANGVNVNGLVINHTAESITAEVPDSAKYVIAYVWNSNLDTTVTAEDMIASVSIIGLSGAKDVAARADIDSIETAVAQTADMAATAKGAVDAITYETQRKNLFDGKLNVGYVAANGTLTNNATYKHTNQIDVHNLVGQTVRAYNFDTLTYIRFVTIYDQSGTAKENLGTNTNGQSFTIPTGAYYMVCSFTNSAINTGFIFLTTTDETLFVPYHNERQIDKYDATLGYISTPEPDVLTADSLAGDGILTGRENSVKTYGTYCFFCKPGTMTDDEYIVFGKNGAQGYGIGVSKTNWAWFVNNVNKGGGAHGLTIKDYLFVTVDKVPGTGAIVHIYTNGGHYTRTNTSWADDHGAPFVSNQSGATITDIKMTWTAKTLRNRIWIFGDSYVSGSDKRWPYYIYDWKFDANLMINGYPGEDAVNGYKDFCNCLRLGTPSIAVWALGMNNPDNGTVNADWLKYTQAFIDVCKAHDIAPILATIPNCPDANHHVNQYKNAWIRGESGCRYIEFANAVNIEQGSTTWYDGMLSSDNIHPDVQGAIALASQVLVDVPEIATR